MEQVKLSDIEQVNYSDLEPQKLKALVNSFDSFVAQLNSQQNPIALDSKRRPYTIINGRHRIYLARQKGYSRVPARLI